MNKKRTTVLIVDDSAVVRKTLKEIISSDPGMEVIGTANDPYFAAEIIKKVIPDVIMLDIEMPRMDGITFLEKIMSQHPIPIVICSSLTGKGTMTAIKAIESGAVEIITKPKMETETFIQESKIRICDAIKAAAKVSVKKINQKDKLIVTPKLSADVILEKVNRTSMLETPDKIIAIGASTGGTEAIKVILQNMPPDCPGILIVQHMPEIFTRSFAQRLNEICAISVKEASSEDTIVKGLALIAPGNKHMLLQRSGTRYYVEIKEGPLVNRHRPSVDVLFRSTARYAGKNAIGVILTGMGDDGAKGLFEMHAAGAFTIAQDKNSCTVFGMPKEAIILGGVNKILPLSHIPRFLIHHFQNEIGESQCL